MSGIYEDMKWSWRSADPKCDIKAQRHAISRSGKRYMASENNRDHRQDCDTKCLDLDMDADSSRDGWLRLGPVDGFDEAYCILRSDLDHLIPVLVVMMMALNIMFSE